MLAINKFKYFKNGFLVMEGFLISLAISAVIIIILYKFAKGVFKIISTLFFILIVVLLIMTIFVYRDINDLQKHATEKNTFLLLKNNDIVAGFKYSPNTEPESFSSSIVSELSRLYDGKDYESMKTDSYQLHIIKYDALSAPLEISGKTFSKEEINMIFEGNSSSQELKNEVFIFLYAKKIESDQLFFVTGYRSDDIIIYPETSLLKFIKYVPSFIISQATKYPANEGSNASEQAKLEYQKIK
jgi:hypothetical protein